jgi:arylsulfatase A-like enzyme
MAKAAIIGEGLGQDEFTDMLAVSFSSPDYIGHSFGPNSVEQEDDFLRLDKELGSLLDFLDSKVGKDQYTVFLSADHGVAHVPGFLKEHNIPAASSDIASVTSILNNALKEKYGTPGLIVSGDNYQLYLNAAAIDSMRLNREEVKNWIIDYLSVEPTVARVFALDKIAVTTLNAKEKEMITNGWYPKRGGDIQVVLQPQTLEGFVTAGTTHGLWNPYDAHIPLLWYGWGIKQGKSNREIYMTDIAPTIAALLHIQMPSGSVGKVVEEAIR